MILGVRIPFFVYWLPLVVFHRITVQVEFNCVHDTHIISVTSLRATILDFSGQVVVNVLHILTTAILFLSPPVQEALKTLLVTVPQPNSPSLPSASAPPQISTRVTLPPIPGTPDTLASVQLLPARYRRRSLVVEEMDYIQVN